MPIQNGSANLVAEDTLIALSGVTHNAIASLLGGSTLTATGINYKNGTAILGSVATLTATGSLIKRGAAILGSIATITCSGRRIFHGTAFLRGVSHITATGSRNRTGSAILQAVSTLTGVAKITIYYYPDGGPVLTGGAADTDFLLTFDQRIQWQTRASYAFNKDFEWNTGLLPLRWYRVQGCCEYPTAAGGGLPGGPQFPGGCEIIGIQTDDKKCVGALGKNQYVQNLVARSVSDLCHKITESKMNWQICSIKQWSRPADGRLVPPGDNCNTLTDVPFSQIPDCLPFALELDAKVYMGITTTVIDSINEYVAEGGAITGGEAETTMSGGSPTTSSFLYSPSGEICLTGGEALTSSSWDSLLVTNMGIYTVIENIEAVFNAGVDGPPLELPLQVIGTNCGTCTSMPLVLYLHHNLANDSILVQYMQRNGLELPTPLPMHYSSRLQSWVANCHLLGTGDDNRGSNESWRFTFEWACLSEIGGDDLGSSSWKFSMLAVRKNEATGLDFDARTMVVFPPDQICLGIQNLGFDFSFRLNTVTKIVSNDLDIVPGLVLLTDNIGLFKSKFWAQNPDFNIRLSKSNVSTAVQRQDIYPIFPQAVVQGV